MNGKAILPGGNAQSLDNVAGQPIAEYTHAKSGAVHKLEGPVNAKNIVFEATGDYNDDDTWTLNDNPITVTYNDGEKLLPTAVLVGDMVQAVIMGNQVKLMLQKPTPQEGILRNGDWKSGIINQRGKDEYGYGYAFDMWFCSGTGTVTLDNDGVIISHTGGELAQLMQRFENSDEFDGKVYTMSVLIKGKIYSFTQKIDFSTFPFDKHFVTEDGARLVFYRANASERLMCSIQCRNNHTTKISAVKLEHGLRFTGWPAWDYGAELLKCQRYAEPQAWQLAYGYARSKSEITFVSNYFFKVEKRKLPIFVINENKTPTVINLSTNQNVSGCTFGQPTAKNKYMFSPKILNSNNAFEVGTLYRIIIPDEAYFVSAEL